MNRLNYHQQRVYEFAKKYPKWHTYANDPLTRGIVKSAERKGYIITNEYHQFKLAGGK